MSVKIKNFWTNETDTQTAFLDESTGYKLLLRLDLPRAELSECLRIVIPSGSSCEDNVHCRDMFEYKQYFGHRFNEINLNMKICEPGAGLGDLLPEFVRQGGEKPTVIDPFSYLSARELFLKILRDYSEHQFVDAFRDAIQLLVQRCEVYLSGQIQHIQLGLREAIDTNAEGICDSFDAIIELYGPSIYHTTDFGTPLDIESINKSALQRFADIQEMKLRLLKDKDSGLILTDPEKLRISF